MAGDCLFGVLTVLLQALPAIDYEKGRGKALEMLEVISETWLGLVIFGSYSWFYLVLLGFSGIYWGFVGFYLFFLVFIGFYLVLLGFSGIYWGFVGFYLFFLVFIGFYLVLLGFSGIYWGFVGFYLFFLVFIGFYWVLVGFIGVLLDLLDRRHVIGND